MRRLAAETSCVAVYAPGLNGYRYMSMVTAGGTNAVTRPLATPTPPPAHDVLRMMAQGYTNAGVARRLFLSERTVEAHVRRLLAKLDIADTEDDHRRVLAVLTYLRTA